MHRGEEPVMYWKVLYFLFVLLLVILPAGCGGGKGEARTEKQTVAAEEPEVTQTQTEVGFTAQVAPIFAGKCNFCHHPDNAVQVDLTQPFDPEVGIIGRPNSWTKSEKTILVVPGDPEASALIGTPLGRSSVTGYP
jgi:hypothetical protein